MPPVVVGAVAENPEGGVGSVCIGSGALTVVPEGPVEVTTTVYCVPTVNPEKVTCPVVAASPATVGCGVRGFPEESWTTYVYDVTEVDTGIVNVTEVFVADGVILATERTGGEGIVTTKRSVCSVGVVSILPMAS